MKLAINILCIAAAAALAGAVNACNGNSVADGGDAMMDVASVDAVDARGVDVQTVDVAGDAGRMPLTVSSINTRFVTREHLLAAFEMQQSGEPLAQAMGKNLAGYFRNHLPPDQYCPIGAPCQTTQIDNDPNPDAGWVSDIPGFTAAVESYEYSKQPMNNVALEGGAGTSFLFGPLVNPMGVTGDAALQLVVARVQHYALSSHVGVDGSNAATAYVVVPAPTNDPTNLFGWRGLWPIIQPFESFDPTIMPAAGRNGNCSITPGDGDDGRAGAPANPVNGYECDYNSLHLPMRATQIASTITPGSSGWPAWKFALWITNYLQIMHDEPAGDPIVQVNTGDLPNVGTPGNQIVGVAMPSVGPNFSGLPGTYLGSSDIEGFQASMMIDELDNAGYQWFSQLTTTDGAALSGFSSVSDALNYDYQAPLRWMPGEIAVMETPDPSGFPSPSYMLSSADSHLLDLLGMLGSYSQLFALTDHGNMNAGGTQTFQAYFDGDPFPNDDQLANGDPTPHDRFLALLKLAFISLDRMHRTQGDIFVDDVTWTAGTSTQGQTLSTTSLAYTMVALRAFRLALTSQLSLYSNSTPDGAAVGTLLDGTSMMGAPSGQTLAQRLQSLLNAHAQLLYNSLTDDNGNALPGWNVSTQMPTATQGDLDSHAAAIRGLLEAFFATNDPRYRARALAVFNRMDSVYFDPAVQIYRSAETPGATIEFTPLRFAVLQSSIRELYKLLGVGDPTGLGALLLTRYGRINKLVLNGWDDINGNGTVDWPMECTQLRAGLPRGGLQMGERALTGELGLAPDGRTPASDRDHDCVPEVSFAQLPSALADDIVFSETP